jgi:hypothetical protein
MKWFALNSFKSLFYVNWAMQLFSMGTGRRRIQVFAPRLPRFWKKSLSETEENLPINYVIN